MGYKQKFFFSNGLLIKSVTLAFLVSGCANVIPTLQNLLQDGLPSPTFNGANEISISVTDPDQDIDISGECDSRISSFELSLDDGSSFQSVASFISKSNSSIVDLSCEDGSFSFQIPSLNSQGIASSDSSKTHKYVLRGMTIIGSTNFAFINLIENYGSLPTSISLAVSSGYQSTILDNAVGTTEVTATVLDLNGDPVGAGFDILLDLSAGGLTSSGGLTATTDSNGEVQFPLTSESGVLGSATSFDVKVSYDSVISNAVSITVDPNAFILSINSAPVNDQVTVGSAFNLEVLVESSPGTPLVGQSVSLNIQSGEGTVSNSPGSTITGGTYSFNVTAPTTTGGPYTYVISAGTSSINYNVSFLPGPVNSVVLSASGTNLTADGNSNSTLTANVRDIYNNLISGVSVLFTGDGGTAGTFDQSTVMTDSSGNASVELTSSTTAGGPHNYTATASSISDTVQVTFSAGTPVNLSLTSGTSNLQADGTSFTALTAHISDQFGNPVENKSVTFGGASGDTGSFNMSSVNTNPSGNASVNLSSSTVAGGPHTYTANSTGLSQDSVDVTFVPGAIQFVSLSLIGSSPITANETTTTDLKATVTDTFYNPISGASVALNIPSNGGTASSPLPTDSNGEAIFTLTSSTVAGSYSYTATSDGKNSSLVIVDFEADDAAIVNLAVTGSDPITVGGSTTTLTASVYDTNMNPVSGESVTLNIPTNGGTTSSALMTNSSGDAMFTLSSSTIAGRYIYTSVANSVNSNTVKVDFDPGAANTLTLTAGSSSLNADGIDNTLLTAHMEDVHGNPVSGITVSFSGESVTNGSFSSPTADTDSNGDAIITLTSSTFAGGPHTYDADALALTTASDQVTFLAGSVNTVELALTGSNPITADETSFTTLRATVKDSFGNLLQGETVELNIPTNGGTVSGTIDTDVNGEATFNLYSSTVAGTYGITATSESVVSSSVDVDFAPGIENSIALSVTGTNPIVVDNNQTTLLATVYDSNMNRVPNSTVTLNIPTNGGTVAGTVDTDSNGDASFTLYSSTIAGSYTYNTSAGPATSNDVSVDFVADSLDSILLSVIGTSNLQANNSDTTTLRATALDFYTNPLSNVSITIGVPANGGSLDGNPKLTNSNGEADFTLTSSLTANTYNYDASSGPVTSDTVAVSFSPLSVDSVTLALTGPSNITVDGNTTTLMATVRDINSNVIPSETVTLNIPVNGGTVAGTVDTDGNGEATFTLYSSTVSGSPNISATAGSKTSNSVGVTFDPDTPTSLSLALTGSSPIPSDESSQTNLTAYLEDTFGNGVPGHTITLNVPTDGGTVAGTVDTDSNGEALFELTSSTVAGTYTYDAFGASLSSNTVNVVFDPGAATSVTLAITGSNSIEANGNTSTTLLATAYDGSLNPVPGTNITLNIPTDGGTVSETNPQLSDINGEAVFTLYSSTIASTRGYTANAGSGTSSGVNITFYPGAVSTVSLSITGSNPIEAGLGNTTNLKATVTDINLNPISSETVTLNIPTNGGSVSGTVDTSPAGEADFTLYSSTVAGSYFYSATASSTNSSSVSVTFDHAPPAQLTLSSNTVNLIANENDQATLTAHLSDSFGNPVDGENITFSGDGGALGTLSSMTVSTNINGDSSVNLTSSTVAGGPHTYTASGPLALSDFVNIEFLSGTISNLDLTVTGSNIIQVGDVITTLQATASDAFFNPVIENVHLNIPINGGTVDLNDITTDSAGNVTFTLHSSTIPGIYSYTTTAATVNSTSKTVEFTPGPVNTIDLTLTGASTIPADGSTTTSFKTILKDVFNNFIPSKNVTLNIPTDGGNIPAGPHLSDVNGEVNFTLTSSTIPGGYGYTATADAVNSSTVNVTFSSLNSLSFSMNDPNTLSTVATNVSSVSVDIQYDSGVSQYCISTDSGGSVTTGVCPGSTWTGTRPTSFSVNNGSNTYYLHVQDISNNLNFLGAPPSHTILYDSDTPTVSAIAVSVNSKTNATSTDITGTCNDTTSNIPSGNIKICVKTSGTCSSIPSDFTITADCTGLIPGSNPGSFSYNIALTENSYTIAAYAIDEAGNESTVSALAQTLIVDHTPPSLSGFNIPASDIQTTMTPYNFDWNDATDLGGSLFSHYDIELHEGTGCADGSPITTSSGASNYSASGLSYDTFYSLKVTAFDYAGNSIAECSSAIEYVEFYDLYLTGDPSGGSMYQGAPVNTCGGTDVCDVSNNFVLNTAESFRDVILENNAVLTVSSSSTGIDGPGNGAIQLDIRRDFKILSGSVIELSARGYEPTYGTGGGQSASSSGEGAGGGGHGGRGESFIFNEFENAIGGVAWGNIINPTELGGHGGNEFGGTGGGRGGGRLNATVLGNFLLEGAIFANGGDATVTHAGGGAGGSIEIDVTGDASWSIGGLLQANGGLGSGFGGHGAGGRIAVKILGTGSIPTNIIQAKGKEGIRHSGAGTVYYKGPSDPNGHLILENSLTLGKAIEPTPLIGSYSFDTVVTLGRSLLKVESGDSLTVGGSPITGLDFNLFRVGNGFVNFDNSNPVTLSGTNRLFIEAGDTPSYDGLVVPVSTDLVLSKDLNVDNLFDMQGKLSHLPNGSSKDHKVNVTAGNINISGIINADGKGYRFSGPGYSSGSSGNGAPGGSHGGYGGDSLSNTSYGSNGDLLNPTNLSFGEFGSSGGESTGVSGRPGFGGGSIALSAPTGNIDLSNATISANGQNAIGFEHGGGAGGAILINANEISGTNTLITANGGDANSSSIFGGGGSGGRISINFAVDSMTGGYDAAIITGAFGGLGGSTPSYFDDGAAGTVVISHASSTTLRIANSPTNFSTQRTTNNNNLTLNKLVVEDNGYLENFMNISTANIESNSGLATIEINGGSIDYTFSNINYQLIEIWPEARIDNSNLIIATNGTFVTGYSHSTDELTIQNGGRLIQGGNNDLFTVSNNLTVDSGGEITHRKNSNSEDHMVNLKVDGTFTLNGIINADGAGYESENGPGSGSSAVGAGHGGIGGRSNIIGTGGTSYGDSNNPTNIGSGGASRSTPIFLEGGHGGGRIDIDNSLGNFILNGIISANGDSGKSQSGSQSGSGSGGSIKIRTIDFDGSGSITVNGGSLGSVPTNYGGGGGGGRIALFYANDLGSITANATGGTGGNALGNGIDGTVNFIPTVPPDAAPTPIAVSFGSDTIYSDGWISDLNGNLSASWTDNATNEDDYVVVLLDSGSVQVCSTGLLGPDSTNGSISTYSSNCTGGSGLVQGEDYTLEIRAVNAYGEIKWTSTTLTLDTNPPSPVPTITGIKGDHPDDTINSFVIISANNPTVDWTGSSDAISSVTYKVGIYKTNATPGYFCGGPFSTSALSYNFSSCTLNETDTFEIHLSAEDEAGNTITAAPFPFTVDITGPTGFVLNGFGGIGDPFPEDSWTPDSDPQVTWESNNGGVDHFEIEIFEDTSMTISRCSQNSVAPGSSPITLSSCALVENQNYYARVRAYDVNGNYTDSTSAPTNLKRDATTPTVSISSTAPNSTDNKASYSFDFSGTDPNEGTFGSGIQKYECRVTKSGSTGSWIDCTSPHAESFSVSDNGSAGFEVRSIDNVGLLSSIASQTWTQDMDPPSNPSITLHKASDPGPIASNTEYGFLQIEFATAPSTTDQWCVIELDIAETAPSVPVITDPCWKIFGPSPYFHNLSIQGHRKLYVYVADELGNINNNYASADIIFSIDHGSTTSMNISNYQRRFDVGAHVGCTTVFGGVACWGDNSHGGLGSGDSTSMTIGLPVPFGSGATDVSVSAAGSTSAGETLGGCAVVDGGVMCWGGGNSSVVKDDSSGDASIHTAQFIDGLSASSGVTGIARSEKSACAIVHGGIKCWGSDFYGEIGNGAPTGTIDQSAPVWVDGLGQGSGVTQITAGPRHFCAIAKGAVYCWGYGGDGRLGNGSISNEESPQMITSLSSGVNYVDAGFDSTCALRGHQVYCWGDNSAGQLGSGTMGGSQLTPSVVSSLDPNVQSITVGVRVACAMSAGTAQCWGDNTTGSLGDGTNTTSASPVVVENFNNSGFLEGVQALSTGGTSSSAHTCVMVNGHVECFGDNNNGQFGVPTSEVPAGTYNLVKLAAYDNDGSVSEVDLSGSAGGSHFCALNNGAAVCWGNNSNLQIGDWQNFSPTVSSLETAIGKNVQAIESGNNHTCAIVGDDVLCWGDNDFGQSGSATIPSNVNLPNSLGLSGVKALSAGADHTCAIVYDGAKDTVKCWGRNDFGQLGMGSTSPAYTNSPQTVQGLPSTGDSSILGLVSGAHHSCAIASDGTSQGLYCWGLNDRGQAGQGVNLDGECNVTNQRYCTVAGEVFFDSSSTQKVDGITYLAAGGAHTCMVGSSPTAEEHALYCWGDNSYGQLQKDPSTPANNKALLPERPPSESSPSNIQMLSFGKNHSCVIEDGELSCWGDNSNFQLGRGTTPTVDHNKFTASNGPYNAYYMTTGENFSVFLNNEPEPSSEGLKGFGANSSDQLLTCDALDKDVPTALQLEGCDFDLILYDKTTYSQSETDDATVFVEIRKVPSGTKHICLSESTIPAGSCPGSLYSYPLSGGLEYTFASPASQSNLILYASAWNGSSNTDYAEEYIFYDSSLFEAPVPPSNGGGGGPTGVSDFNIRGVTGQNDEIEDGLWITDTINPVADSDYLRWEWASNSSSYDLEIIRKSDLSVQCGGTITGLTDSKYDLSLCTPALTYGVDYYVKVTATNGTDSIVAQNGYDSSHPNPFTFKAVSPGVAPFRILGVSGNGGFGGDTTIRNTIHTFDGSGYTLNDFSIHWEEAQGAWNYQVSVLNSSSTEVCSTTIGNGNTTSYNFTNSGTCNLPNQGDHFFIHVEAIAQDTVSVFPAINGNLRIDITSEFRCDDQNTPQNVDLAIYPNIIFTDKGGPFSSFPKANCSVIFSNSNPNAQIEVQFSSFDITSNLTLYDGPTISDTILNSSTGNTLPNGGNPILSSLGVSVLADYVKSGGGSDIGWISNVTLQEAAPPTFAIEGVLSSGGAPDNIVDNYLVGGTSPRIQWQDSVNVSSYNVYLLDSKGETEVCPPAIGILGTQTGPSRYYDFSTCNLTDGTRYRVKIYANIGSNSYPASNNGIFEFEMGDPSPYNYMGVGTISANDPDFDKILRITTMEDFKFKFEPSVGSGSIEYTFRIFDTNSGPTICEKNNVVVGSTLHTDVIAESATEYTMAFTMAECSGIQVGGSYRFEMEAKNSSTGVVRRPDNGSLEFYVGNAILVSSGYNDQEQFGSSILFIPDINQDGYTDFVVSSPNENRVTIYSGKTKNIFREIYGPEPSPNYNVNFGYAVSYIPDFDGDGFGEIAIGDPQWNSGLGKVYLYDTKYFNQLILTTDTGVKTNLQGVAGSTNPEYFGKSITYTNRLGTGLYSQRPHIIIGSPGEDTGNGIDSGRVVAYYYDKGTNSIKLRFGYNGISGGVSLGQNITNLGDIDRDTIDDIAIHRAGRFEFLSGIDFSSRYDFSGTEFGASVIGSDDSETTPDGRREIIIGDPQAGQIYFLEWDGSSIVSDSALNFTGPSTDRFGEALALGDVNLDGKQDLIVGSPDYNNGSSNVGRIQIFNFSGSSWDPISASFDKEGTESGQKFGQVIASGFDLDRDGRHDYAVSAPLTGNNSGYSDYGRVYVFPGEATVSVTLSSYHNTNSASGSGTITKFGKNLTYIGDFDGDGHDNYAIADSEYDPGAITAKGRVWIFRLNKFNGAFEEKYVIEHSSGNAGDKFGSNLIGAGDFNGDGLKDLVVSSPDSDGIYANEGALLLYYFNGSSPVEVELARGQNTSARVGNIALENLGDINNDGFDDVGFSDINSTNQKIVNIIYGDTSSPSIENVFIEEVANTNFGGAIAAVEDMDNDGYKEILIGATTYDGDSGAITNSGKVYMYSGSDQSLMWSKEGETANELFGTSLSSIGYLDNMGFPYFAVGAPYHNSGDGKVYLFSGITPSNFAGEIPAEVSSLENMGISLTSLDFDGDGFNEIVAGAPQYDGSLIKDGRVKVYNILKSSLLTYPGINSSDETYGQIVESAGDINMDGIPDLFIAAPYSGSVTSGRTEFLTVRP